MLQVELLDRKKISFDKPFDGFELTKKISKSLEKIALIMEVDGELKDLSFKIKKNSKGYYYMINCECDAKLFKDFDIKVKQDINFLRFFNIRIKEIIKEQSLLVEQKT